MGEQDHPGRRAERADQVRQVERETPEDGERADNRAAARRRRCPRRPASPARRTASLCVRAADEGVGEREPDQDRQDDEDGPKERVEAVQHVVSRRVADHPRVEPEVLVERDDPRPAEVEGDRRQQRHRRDDRTDALDELVVTRLAAGLVRRLGAGQSFHAAAHDSTAAAPSSSPGLTIADDEDQAEVGPERARPSFPPHAGRQSRVRFAGGARRARGRAAIPEEATLLRGEPAGARRRPGHQRRDADGPGGEERATTRLGPCS